MIDDSQKTFIIRHPDPTPGGFIVTVLLDPSDDMIVRFEAKEFLSVTQKGHHLYRSDLDILKVTEDYDQATVAMSGLIDYEMESDFYMGERALSAPPPGNFTLLYVNLYARIAFEACKLMNPVEITEENVKANLP